jgi:NADH-quinone oxidoreductase subunit J
VLQITVFLMLDTALFYTFALITLTGAILTITRRNAVHSAIWLIFALLGVAGLYLLQQAEFLAGVQVILYIGGIMVLFLFVIMLVNLDEAAKERQYSSLAWVSLVCVAALGLLATWFVLAGRSRFQLGTPSPEILSWQGLGNTERVSRVLFTQYLLPFEIASILLLVAVVGAVVMAKKRI